MLLQAVVFDFDGVIIDTEKARYEAMQEIYSSYGQKLPLDIWLKSVGHASYVIHPFDLLMDLTGKRLDCEMLKSKHKEIEMEFADALPVLPGVVDRLEEVCASGGKLAIASSSSRGWVEGHLKKRDLFRYFNVTVCRGDTVNHKPDPEPYLTALRLMRCSAEHAFAVEDSPTGINAALSAGMTCIAVGCSLTRNLDLSKAHYVFDSLSSVSFIELGRNRQ